jgi:hypothetical protein
MCQVFFFIQLLYSGLIHAIIELPNLKSQWKLFMMNFVRLIQKSHRSIPNTNKQGDNNVLEVSLRFCFEGAIE